MLTRRNVYILLLLFGGLQLVLTARTSDFMYDSYYYELARSILAKAGYGFNSRPEPMVPPGFPAMLAILILMVGHSYALLIRSMAFFTTLGLIAAYEILNAEEGALLAGVASLLLASSPTLFEFATRMLFSDMPYFFTSMFLLWALRRLDAAGTRAAVRALWWAVCALLLVASILLRSTGIALAGGISAWLVISRFRERKPGASRVTMFLALVVVALVTEAGWMLWAKQHPVSLWPVHGFQESYIAQLKLKNGNNPELGMATRRDLLTRPVENEDDIATAMFALFAHKQLAPALYSPTTVIPLVLLVIGLAYSFRKTGGRITEWYFVCYQLLYLFWPWNFEMRFQIPVAPLAALYMWRGGRTLWQWVRSMPRQAGVFCLTAAVLGAVSSTVWGWRIRHPYAPACIAIWLLIGILSTLILAGRTDWIQRPCRLLRSTRSLGGMRLSLASVAGRVVLACMLVAGIGMQTVAGVQNWHTVPEMNPNIEAAEWIRDHSPAGAVVMARWEALVYHYSQRRVIWFPASTDPALLMAGIRRHGIGLIVVTEDEENSYWKPSDRHCFQLLMRAYPGMFQQVHQGAHEQVYKLLHDNELVAHSGTS